MDVQKLRQMMKKVQNGELSVEDALTRLRHLPFESLEQATLDHHRSLRCGFPEVIFCGGKSEKQIMAIVEKMLARGESVLATRVEPGVAGSVAKKFPKTEHNSLARTVFISRGKRPKKEGLVLVVCAGTSDIPVAEEACVTAGAMGCNVERLFDVGIAGIHRIISHRKKLWDADAIVVAAGMEGALASVVAGMTDRPVVAVPTSVGYGASFGGIAALLGMLNSCAAGVTVVNIDNGFGAGYAAGLVARKNKSRENPDTPGSQTCSGQTHQRRPGQTHQVTGAGHARGRHTSDARDGVEKRPGNKNGPEIGTNR